MAESEPQSNELLNVPLLIPSEMSEDVLMRYVSDREDIPPEQLNEEKLRYLIKDLFNRMTGFGSSHEGIKVNDIFDTDTIFPDTVYALGIYMELLTRLKQNNPNL